MGKLLETDSIMSNEQINSGKKKGYEESILSM